MRAFVSVVMISTSLWLTCSDASAHIPHDETIQVLASPAFATDQTVFAISRDRLLRSTNSGASWTEVVRGLDRHTPVRLAIAPSDKRIMYLSMLGGGIYRSSDQGWTWGPTTNLPAMRDIVQLAASPSDPGVVFAAGLSTGLFRTSDGGQTWAQVAGFGRVTVVHFARNGRAIVGDASGSVFTSDNGNTWVQASGTPTGDMITAIDSTRTPGTVFVGTRLGRLLRSTNHGGSFTTVGSGLPAEQITAIATSTNYQTDTMLWVSTWNQGVYRSTNAAATFSRKSTGLTTDSQAGTEGAPQFGDLSVAVATGAQVLFVGGFDGVFRSTNRADLWNEVQTLTDYVVGLAVSPNYEHDRTVVATTYVKGAYLSNDAGQTWRGSHVGLGMTSGNKFAPIFRLHNVQFSPNYATDGTIFTATWWDLLKSTDRGTSWTKIAVGTAPAGALRQFVIAPSPAYAADRTIFVATRQGEIYRSTAAGAAGTWTLLANLGAGVRSLVLSPTFATDRTLYAGAANGVFTSVDGGSHWSRTGPSAMAMLAISSSYGTDGTVFAGTTSGIFVTRDEGQSWTELTTPPMSTTTNVEAIAVSPDYANDQTVLVSVLGKGLFRSTNGGQTFAPTGIDLFLNNLLIADFANPTSAPLQFSSSYAQDRTIYAMAQQRVVKSTDGGDSWQVLGLPPATALLAPPVIAAEPTPRRVVEGGSGQRIVPVAFDLSHPSGSNVTVEWQTLDVPGNPSVASAAAGDYVPSSGTLVYPRGTTRQFVNVTVNGDSLDEADEAIVVATRNATNATIGGFLGLGSAIIEDDDPLPTLTPGAASAAEGDAGSSVLVIPVALSPPSGRTVTVDWATADYEAVAGEDFAADSGTLTFLPGERTKVIEITVLGDTAVEPDEWLVVTTANPTNARLGGFWGLGLGRILNDDAAAEVGQVAQPVN